jgi:hypothetical protein
MSLDQRPQIDPFSKNNEEAERTFITYFNQRTGFIPRQQTPDKGCDYLLELINNKSATNWYVSVQLKSIEKPKFVQNGCFISYPFETSRLGYLLDDMPCRGVIVLFDIESKCMYYDYAELINLRLLDDRVDIGWQLNKKVNILVPVKNKLDLSCMGDIHLYFINRFQATKAMTKSHGHAYGIPLIEKQSTEEWDFNNIPDIKRFLKRLGMSYFANRDIDLLYDLISKIPSIQICADKDLIILAILVYAEVGRAAESNYFADRLQKSKHELTQEECNRIAFTILKNEIYLGEVDVKEFIKRSIDLLDVTSDRLNRIVIKLNIHFYKILDIRVMERMPAIITAEINELSSEINQLDDSEAHKFLFKIWNAENVALWIAHFRNESYSELIIGEYLGTELPLEDRIAKAQQLTKIHDSFYGILKEVEEHALKTSNDLLRANVIDVLIKFKLEFELQNMRHRILAEREHIEGQKERLFSDIRKAGFAIDILSQKQFLKSAYDILCCQIELIHISRMYYGYEDLFDLNYILTVQIEFESELELSPYELRYSDSLKDVAIVEKDVIHNFINSGQLNNIADMIIRTNKFPNANKVHLVNEMKALITFKERCKDSHIEILVNLIPNFELRYVAPTSFKLRNIKTDFESDPSADINELLTSFGY